jgi:ketosteroid isomerase-like protein
VDGVLVSVASGSDVPLADRLLAAFEAHDPEAVAACLTPDVRRWLNITDEEIGLDGILALVAAEHAVVAVSKMVLRRRLDTEDGFVLQFDADGTTHSGEDYHIPVCLVATVDGDRVCRIEEYADLGQAQPIVRAMGRV